MAWSETGNLGPGRGASNLGPGSGTCNLGPGNGATNLGPGNGATKLGPRSKSIGSFMLLCCCVEVSGDVGCVE